MKTYNHPNVSVTLSEGDRDVSFDCPGRCKFALCPNNPPAPDDRCAFEQYGCTLQIAKVTALKALYKYCAREIHIIEDEIQEEEGESY